VKAHVTVICPFNCRPLSTWAPPTRGFFFAVLPSLPVRGDARQNVCAICPIGDALPVAIHVTIFPDNGEVSAVMRLLAPIACIVLCGCTAHVSDPFWVRSDGRPLDSKQFEADRAACMAEAQKGEGPEAAPGNAVRVCMAQRGYLEQFPQ
jgi:hypothetical protein